HLPAETDEERESVATLDREQPLATLDEAIEDLVVAIADLSDLTRDQRYKVDTIKRDAPKVGRNDPCPCGSGKRYKHCHGAAATSAVATTRSEQRLREAMRLHQRGTSEDKAAAETIYREVLALQPGNALAQHFLGVIHYQRGEIAVALPLLERAVAAQPSEAEFHNNLGLALAAADREGEAIAEY